jgi:hypothetical protein
MELDSLPQIILVVIGLVIAWVVLRFLLRLASKIFSIGCSLLFLLAAILILVRIIKGP